jgi:biopolymer transport protein ExbD
MGASIAEGGFDDDEDFAEAHEINVTPFIDVMLVLLIIFMVAAPLSTVDLPIDLPTSSAQPQKKPDKPVYVSIKPDLTVAIGEKIIKRAELIATLDAAAESNPERLVFARRPRGRLWRPDGRAGIAASGKLPDEAGRARGRCRRRRTTRGRGSGQAVRREP